VDVAAVHARAHAEYRDELEQARLRARIAELEERVEEAESRALEAALLAEHRRYDYPVIEYGLSGLPHGRTLVRRHGLRTVSPPTIFRRSQPAPAAPTFRSGSTSAVRGFKQPRCPAPRSVLGTQRMSVILSP
jgi:hypothetical protein